MNQDPITRLQHFLADYALDAFLIEKDEDISYFLRDQARSGTLLVSRDEAVFFISPLDRDLYAHVQGVALVFCSKSVDQELFTYVEDKGLKTIGFDGEYTPYRIAQDRISSGYNFSPRSLVAEKLRCLKGPDEIQKMLRAAEIGSAGYDFILTALCPGITEREVVRLLHVFWANLGIEKVSFPPIIAFGENAAFPHAIPTNRALKKGDVVLIDIGVCYEGYCSDMTRTVAFGGAPEQQILDGYVAVAEAQRVALEFCREGVPCRDVHEQAVRVLREYGIEKAFIHGLGHGVGREVHEYPRLSPSSEANLQVNMAVTIEPGVYFPGIGGIRIEDTLVIGDKENLNLTNRPVSPEIIII
ncbi:aminopeptidase P family protein [Chlamydia sp.]|uniref:M24 family metallopeptidase n=1 Tax=Chlamydia sp. TaxID=35827 RepID=UPI0025BD0975|nr:aminopeptidase P family protein [Chlamydia sp.]MBQ8498931.1 aminopeptidase P family protein [Chlamydia sp.]